MRAALLVALALAGAAVAQEVAVDPDLDAFTDHLADALDLEGVEAWEERLDPAHEESWLAGREVEPGVDDLTRPPARAVVGLTARAGDLAITRLVAPDAARASAFALRLLAGHAAPLGAGPRGQAPGRLPLLLEVRGRHLLLVRGEAAADLARALPARAAAWETAGLPAPDAPAEGLALLDRGVEALAFVREGVVAERLRALPDPPLPPGVLAAVASGDEGHALEARLLPAGGAGWRAQRDRAPLAARDQARALAAALGLSLDLDQEGR